jgi:hypothetical protein
MIEDGFEQGRILFSSRKATLPPGAFVNNVELGMAFAPTGLAESRSTQHF